MTFDWTWTEERVATLRKLIGDGYSASRAAEMLGCSRNAVIGKAARNGIGFVRRPGPLRLSPIKAAERQTPFRKPAMPAPVALPPPPPPGPTIPPDLPLMRVAQGIACMWVTKTGQPRDGADQETDDGLARYCALPAVRNGVSWCQHHLGVVAAKIERRAGAKQWPTRRTRAA